MLKELELEILAQPDDNTCGPTCLQAVYRYFEDELPLEQVIRETPRLEHGGTLAVLLGSHALRRGYKATIYTYNLQVFDPTWFRPKAPPIAERLKAQRDVKDSAKLHRATEAYLEFLDLGGKLKMEDLRGSLIRRHLKKSVPILTGLSSTYLYQCEREFGIDNRPDDIRGLSAGHFVVLCGFDKTNKRVNVADPYLPNPLGPANHYYTVGLERVVCAILLGILTYDANLLIIQPRKKRNGLPRVDVDHRQQPETMAGAD